MPQQDIESVVKAVYEAYVRKDRAAIERLIAPDFSFTSPLDNGLSRETYFERCWQNSENIQSFEFVHIASSKDHAFVTYEGSTTGGHRFRNTELLFVRDNQVTDVEVYFGWSIPHKAPAGGFVEQA